MMGPVVPWIRIGVGIGDTVSYCDTVNDFLVRLGSRQLYSFVLRSQGSGLGGVPAYTTAYLSCSHLMNFAFQADVGFPPHRAQI